MRKRTLSIVGLLGLLLSGCYVVPLAPRPAYWHPGWWTPWGWHHGYWER
ncbi:MAG TPA: hypothetical protein VFN52_05405 [Acidiferrobacteraceae bacterium]|nr:hypothetical protein [Acidiferrobacteraceae bacterium]